MNYEFNLLHHVGVVAKRLRAAAAHKGDDITSSGRGVKTHWSLWFIQKYLSELTVVTTFR